MITDTSPIDDQASVEDFRRVGRALVAHSEASSIDIPRIMTPFITRAAMRLSAVQIRQYLDNHGVFLTNEEVRDIVNRARGRSWSGRRAPSSLPELTEHDREGNAGFEFEATSSGPLRK